MIEKQLDIINKLGLHARAAAKVVSVASRYESRIHVIHNGNPIDAKSIMGLLMLGAAKGTSVTFQVDGNDETAAMEELTDLFGRRFDEEE
ncbi:MAG TPA: HPr family phosphocarrier protein [Alcanivorax sp.]|jgi:phosphocarrier protein NPr/phosphocarrier protein|uniref:Phosphotransferase system n=1 Tax=Alcanivorax jadensis T9 TaxID=1177181 RepID=A0ABR4WCD7_9GAMM|nr:MULTISPECIES: HPr family phosphocarrier protein [Alcanivorax]KGD60875.1 phosphotransferase system [Alcanivorax jadensis T9]MAC15754.1 HPr family phosphocarrier protein [Alcanivorax sp.]MBG32640.1 HPr family phosphocarrier protein [Alcanivorax sp.]MBL4569549.1 HPr family phosphocarrier protein [Alcanivorax sp.]MBP21506.1 HPr family phosphocarrier protein [Alcanivorax sp.]|tara:strand:- start:771 stop:1040 length:270 start_codon:yes stop_codon:yes gene_type:complete